MRAVKMYQLTLEQVQKDLALKHIHLIKQKQAGYLIFYIIQDIEQLPSIDGEAQLSNVIDDFEIELVNEALSFAESIETTATTFIDELVSAFDTGVKIG